MNVGGSPSREGYNLNIRFEALYNSLDIPVEWFNVKMFQDNIVLVNVVKSLVKLVEEIQFDINGEKNIDGTLAVYEV